MERLQLLRLLARVLELPGDRLAGARRRLGLQTRVGELGAKFLLLLLVAAHGVAELLAELVTLLIGQLDSVIHQIRSPRTST